MGENKKKLGKNAEIELDESGVEQVSGGWGLDSIRKGFNYVAEKTDVVAGEVNKAAQSGSNVVGAVQAGFDAVTDASCQAMNDVADTAKGFNM